MLKSRGPIATSGFNIQLSGAEGLPAQVSQAARFLRNNREELARIRELGLAAPVVDFGLHDLATEECPWPSYRIPSTFVRLVADLGCSIDLSFYGQPPGAP